MPRLLAFSRDVQRSLIAVSDFVTLIECPLPFRLGGSGHTAFPPNPVVGLCPISRQKATLLSAVDRNGCRIAAPRPINCP